jgi:hypothetical protein
VVSTVKKIYREPISWKSLEKEYSDIFWLKTFFDIRTYEANVSWDKFQKEQKFKRALAIKKTFDIDRAMYYINKEILKETPYFSDLGKINSLIK